jgi:hypothetical protein
MRGPAVALVFSVALVFLSGCAVNLPFNHRLAYASVRDAKQMHRIGARVIAIRWIPETFPESIDVQGASGVVGSASQTRIPTGVGLASRILEVLDAAIGVDDSYASLMLRRAVVTARQPNRDLFPSAVDANVHILAMRQPRPDAVVRIQYARQGSSAVSHRAVTTAQTCGSCPRRQIDNVTVSTRRPELGARIGNSAMRLPELFPCVRSEAIGKRVSRCSGCRLSHPTRRGRS